MTFSDWIAHNNTGTGTLRLSVNQRKGRVSAYQKRVPERIKRYYAEKRRGGQTLRCLAPAVSSPTVKGRSPLQSTF